ncbi:hypothetical protein CSV80_14330 [Sporosarcina sp. P12(2017)]|nr:hypothetical protein CSV81_14195 [Sporosarcina sp. P10]PIC59722.1 hypothetical protein CSV80_14330 [Sporosarcina sp. P12(2017)]
MIHILKNKLLTSILVILNIGFIVSVMDSNATQGIHTNILFSLTSSIILVIVFSLIYIAPLIIVLGIPVSILIDRYIIRFKKKNIMSLFLHMFIGCIIAVIILSLLKSDLIAYKSLVNEFYLIKLLFICLYPGLNFWFVDLVITKGHKNK